MTTKIVPTATQWHATSQKKPTKIYIKTLSISSLIRILRYLMQYYNNYKR